MKANTGTTVDPTTSPKRRVLALGVVGLMALTACTSDPGPRRVAEDIIEAEFEEGNISESEKDCMFDVLEDDYTEGDLERIASQIDNSDEATVSEGEAELAQLRRDLERCRA